MAIFRSDLEKAKELFNRKEYKAALELFIQLEQQTLDMLVAAGLKDISSKMEVLNYLGLMYENGLGYESDLLEAEKYYTKAYSEGDVPTSLARVQYRLGKENLAIALYQSIEADHKVNPLSRAEAIYNLAQISAAKRTDSYNKIDKLYDEAIALYQEFSPESIHHAEALYSKGQLYLEQIKQAKLPSEEILDLEKKCLMIFQEAASFGYLPSQMASLDIEANNLLKKGNYEEALEICDSALFLDSENIVMKITKATILEVQAQQKSLNVLDAVEEYDQALSLAREVMIEDPAHAGKAYALRRSLENNLNRVVSLSVCQSLKEMTANKTPEMSFVIEELGPEIANLLTKFPQLVKQISFADVPQVGNLLAKEIMLNSQVLLEQISQNTNIDQEKLDGKLGKSKNSPDINSGARNKLLANVRDIIEGASSKSISVSDEDLRYIDKRKVFQDAVQSRLYNFYDTCQELLQDDIDIETILQDDSSYETWSAYVKQKVQFASSYVPEIAQNILVNMAPTAGAFAGSAIIAAATVIKPLIPKAAELVNDKLAFKDEYDKKELLKISIRNFCDKMNHRDMKGEYFKIIAEELTKKYGMQIDNITHSDMRKLANVAVKKMFNKVHNQVKKGNVYSALPKFVLPTQEDNTIDFFIEAVANEGNRDKFTSVMEVNLMFGGKWKIDDAFEKPVITVNGKDFYKKSSSNVVYGCIHQETKPLGYEVCKDLSLSVRGRLEDGFKSNARRTFAMEKMTPGSKRDNVLEKELQEYKHNFYKEEKKLGQKTTKLGVAVTAAAIVLGIVIGIGLMGPFFAIPAAAMCIAGLYVLRNGLQKDLNASENLKILDNSRAINERERGDREINIERQINVPQQQIEGSFTKKFAHKAKPKIESLKARKIEKRVDRESDYRTISK